MKVLVTGGRDYANYEYVNSILSAIHKEKPIELIINGAAKGADDLSTRWAKENKVLYVEYPANWKRFGKSAGVIRNKEMLDKESPDIVVAFKGGRGTANMVDLATQLSVYVIDCRAELSTEFYCDIEYGGHVFTL